MSPDEFKIQLARLRETPTQKFKTQTFASTLWHSVKDLKAMDLKVMVDKVLLGKYDFDFMTEIEAIKRNRANLALTAKAVGNEVGITDNGLSKVLEQIGVGSLVDAIFASRVGVGEFEVKFGNNPLSAEPTCTAEKITDSEREKAEELKAIAELKWKQKLNRGIE